MVSLTGSVETGKHVMELAAAGLKRVALELGGKNPNIVFGDADLDAAAMWAGIAAFSNAGQVCVSGSRLLIDEKVHDDLVKRVVEQAKALKIGDPLDESTQMGPLVSRKQRDRVLEYVRIGVAEGARLVFAGRIDAGQVYVNGYYSPAMSESPAVGHKQSGVGEAGYLKYTVPKTVFVRLQS
jgi:betaine-aldehyde dehydrogenase